MLGIEDYGSDVESGDEGLKQSETTTTTSSLLSKLPPPKSESTFTLPPPKFTAFVSLPAPSNSTPSSSTAPSKQKRIKKIAVNLPSLPPPEDDEDSDTPPAKKPRITSSNGAGVSSLLGMLPAPKQPTPVIAKKEERVLGGGSGPGLVFRKPAGIAQQNDTAVPTSVDVPSGDAEGETGETAAVTTTSTSFLPPSLKPGRANISLETNSKASTIPSSSSAQPKTLAAPDVDFFSLGTSTTRSRQTIPSTSSAPVVTSAPGSTPSSSFTVSSAPTISTFRPPSPTLDDPYPGYYQLPSGAYAPYDAQYYASYAKKWQKDYDKHIRALEKSQYETETDGAPEVDMAAEMEKARLEIKEREERKALTAAKVWQGEDGEQPMPKMNVKGAKLGAVARSRHQLTTLLTEAYLNREALEEKIAQGRRNRKEAGNKYGF